MFRLGRMPTSSGVNSLSVGIKANARRLDDSHLRTATLGTSVTRRRGSDVLRNGVPVSSLSSLLIFADCGDLLLRKLSHLGTEVHAKERQVLAKEGEPGREFYVIASGSAEVLIGERKVTTLTRGDFFGEMAL